MKKEFENSDNNEIRILADETINKMIESRKQYEKDNIENRVLSNDPEIQKLIVERNKKVLEKGKEVKKKAELKEYYEKLDSKFNREK